MPRAKSDYKWASLQPTVKEAPDSVPALITIRKFARQSWRYISAYRRPAEEQGELLGYREAAKLVKSTPPTGESPMSLLIES